MKKTTNFCKRLGLFAEQEKLSAVGVRRQIKQKVGSSNETFGEQKVRQNQRQKFNTSSQSFKFDNIRIKRKSFLLIFLFPQTQFSLCLFIDSIFCG